MSTSSPWRSPARAPRWGWLRAETTTGSPPARQPRRSRSSPSCAGKARCSVASLGSGGRRAVPPSRRSVVPPRRPPTPGRCRQTCPGRWCAALYPPRVTVRLVPEPQRPAAPTPPPRAPRRARPAAEPRGARRAAAPWCRRAVPPRRPPTSGRCRQTCPGRRCAALYPPPVTVRPPPRRVGDVAGRPDRGPLRADGGTACGGRPRRRRPVPSPTPRAPHRRPRPHGRRVLPGRLRSREERDQSPNFP